MPFDVVVCVIPKCQYFFSSIQLFSFITLPSRCLLSPSIYISSFTLSSLFLWFYPSSLWFSLLLLFALSVFPLPPSLFLAPFLSYPFSLSLIYIISSYMVNALCLTYSNLMVIILFILSNKKSFHFNSSSSSSVNILCFCRKFQFQWKQILLICFLSI